MPVTPLQEVHKTLGYQNTSGLEPLGNAVLVEPYEPDIQLGVIEIPEDIRKRAMMVEQRVIVIAIGPECWKDEKGPRANPGDKVLVAKFAGYEAKGTADGKNYRMINCRDIFCKIAKESPNG